MISGRFRGMYWRQLFVTAGMVLLTLILLGMTFFFASYQYVRYEKSAEIERRARDIGLRTAEYLDDTGLSSVRQLGGNREFEKRLRFAASSDVQFLICDRKGRVVLATDDALAAKTPSVALSSSITAEKSVRRDLEGERRFVVGVSAVKPGTEPVGLVFAVFTEESLDTLWRGFTAIFFATAFAVLLIAIIASSLMASHLVKPLREMVQATRQYGEGNFDIRMGDDGRTDEIGELAASFNQMADSLQLQEQQRREFISNVSHDLKTPLTTIAGYTDGILDGTIPPESERKYLEIISEESRRLSRMVRRMLDVSQIQAVDPLRNGAAFDLCESMRRVLISMEKKITDRKLDVDADIPEEPIYVFGDQDMITQVIYNLLENAAKFAREGSTLYLGLAPREGKACVTVRNLGATIPPEELPRLFDRFHKGDKSRGEDRDGVGLGLYIVKTILKQHREEIFASSEYGVTEFSFGLKIV